MGEGADEIGQVKLHVFIQCFILQCFSLISSPGDQELWGGPQLQWNPKTWLYHLQVIMLSLSLTNRKSINTEGDNVPR